MCQNLCVKREAGKSEIEKKQTVFLEVGQDRDYLTEFKVIVHFWMEQPTSKENQGQNSVFTSGKHRKNLPKFSGDWILVSKRCCGCFLSFQMLWTAAPAGFQGSPLHQKDLGTVQFGSCLQDTWSSALMCTNP